MAHYAKPGNEPAFTAEFNATRKVWQIVGRDGVVEGGVYTNEKYAKSLAGQKSRLVVKAEHPERPCMCCGTKFPSQGIHNRLCNTCRNRGSSEAMPAGYSFGSMTGKKRA